MLININSHYIMMTVVIATFLFLWFSHAPELKRDFSLLRWSTHYMISFHFKVIFMLSYRVVMIIHSIRHVWQIYRVTVLHIPSNNEVRVKSWANTEDYDDDMHILAFFSNADLKLIQSKFLFFKILSRTIRWICNKLDLYIYLIQTYLYISVGLIETSS